MLLSEKYRPTKLDDFQLPGHITGAIRSLIALNRPNVLIHGVQSCGKTAILNALIREYYGGDFLAHPTQIMYINNLREQGVRFYRTEMQSFCKSTSVVPGKKKLIIVDDLDNINEQSQHVFRSYIDAYESNVCFMMACTNLQRVVESIQSNMHIIRIHPLTLDQIGRRLNHVAQSEGIQVTPRCHQILLNASGGSIKSAMNCMDKIRILTWPESMTCLDLPADQGESISSAPTMHLQCYFTNVRDGQLQEAMKQLFYLYDRGYSVIDILDYLYQFIKLPSDVFSEPVRYAIIPVLCKYITIFYNLHEDRIELALLTHELRTAMNDIVVE